MELEIVNTRNNVRRIDSETTPAVVKNNINPFIEANTKEVSLSHLENKCTIPVFAKDNEVTLSHQEFINSMVRSVSTVFPDNKQAQPDIRVSHVIKGRIPEAIRKPANALLEHEKTIYYERMAFIVNIPNLTQTIGVNSLSLTVGGVRAYNQENLYSKKSIEKFKIFIGFKNKVCTNLCISTDGFLSELRVSSVEELEQRIMQLFRSYDAEKHLLQMKALQNQYLTESQFAQILGKARLYNYLPKNLKQQMPELSFNDGQLNAIAKDYYEDESFSRDSNGNISLWSLYNLFTGANKSSYIDSFLSRNVNAFEFSNGLAKALNGDSNYHWFLS